MKSIGIKTSDGIVFPPLVAKKRQEFKDKIKEGSIVEEELTVKHLDKTKEQLGNIFGNMIRKVVDYCDDEDHIVDTSEFLDLLFNQRDIPTGVPVTSDFVKNCLYMACPTLNKKDRPITLRGMDIPQANKFFKDSADLLSSRIVYIPDPDPNWRKAKNSHNERAK